MNQKQQKVKQTFLKIVHLYNKHYENNIPSFANFLNEKVDCSSSYFKDIIKNRIVELKGEQRKFKSEELQDFLHLIAAVQSGKQINQIEDYSQYNEIKFISKKKKKGEHNKQENIGIIQKEYKTLITQEVHFKKSYSQTEMPTIVQDQSSMEFSALFQKDMIKLQQKSIKISCFEKFGQDYHNPIIKYKILFSTHTVYRRFTEFQKLMSFLGQKYEGFFLPQLPPKQGIKRNLAFFIGLDEAFLNNRLIKLQQLLNSLIILKDVGKNGIFQKFIIDQNFDIAKELEEHSYSYMQAITNIAFSTKQIKDYGIAGFNYLKQYSTKPQLNNNITNKYNSLNSLINNILTINNYRLKINKNFDQRRTIFKELKCDKTDRNFDITEFDKVMEMCSKDIKNLNNQYAKYRNLKSQQSWLSYLVKQKELQKGQNYQKAKKEKRQVEVRIQKMQINITKSFEEFLQDKTNIYQHIEPMLIEWRRQAHP